MSEAGLRAIWATASAAAAAAAWYAGSWGAARAGTRTGGMPWPLPLAAACCGTALAGAPAPALLAVTALAAAAIDLRCGLIPDALIAPALAMLLVMRAGSLADALAGAAVCAALLAAPWALSRGRGFGLGDVKFGLVLGAAFGPPAGVAAIGAAFIAGGLFGAILLMTRSAGRRSALPFAPFLAIGAGAVQVFGGLYAS